MVPGLLVQAGIDEAGRGPVLGPLVVAGVALADEGVLYDLGVRDSKRLSPAQRERLARLIQDLPGVQTAVEVLQPADLDAWRQTASLNDIEADLFGRVARTLGPARLIVDAADVDAARFGARIRRMLPADREVVSEHGADDRHVVVGAASILAKVTRDAAVEGLARRLERRLAMPMGSGYPGDRRTQAFLQAYVDAYGDLPEGCRRSWQTAGRLLADFQTRRLDTF